MKTDNLKTNNLTPTKVVQFTHQDLDGVGCAILARAFFGEKNVETEYCGYNNVDERVKEFLQEVNDLGQDPAEVLVLITDLSVNEETAEMLNSAYFKGLNVQLIDHHKTADWLNKYEWAFVDTSKCGTLLSFEYYGSMVEFEYFARVVNDYDLWIHNDPNSKELNRIYGILGRERFVDWYTKSPFTGRLNAFEKYLLELDKEREDRFQKKVKETLHVDFNGLGQKFGIGFADQYVNEVAHNLIDELELDFIALVDVYGEKVQLRSRPEVDVSEVAKVFGGGGHKNAAGFQLKTKPIDIRF